MSESTTQFNAGNIEQYKSAVRLKEGIRNTSWPVLKLGLIEYCNWLGKDPDAIMADRRVTFKSDDEEIKRTHEESYAKFSEYLTTRKSKRGDGMIAPATANNMLVAVRGLYDHNYYPLVRPKKFDVYNVRALHVPTLEEVGKMLDVTAGLVQKTAMLAAAQSGIGVGDLTRITWDTQSDTWGTIKEQIDGGGLEINGKKYPLIHIHMIRKKTHVAFDTFFGKATFDMLTRPDYPKDDKEGKVFPISIRHLEYVTERATKKVGIKGIVTPHCYRKFFTTTLKLTPEGEGTVNNDLIEYWTGHALGRTKGAYLIPPPYQQAALYLRIEHRVTPNISDAALNSGDSYHHQTDKAQTDRPIDTGTSVEKPAAGNGSETSPDNAAMPVVHPEPVIKKAIKRPPPKKNVTVDAIPTIILPPQPTVGESQAPKPEAPSIQPVIVPEPRPFVPAPNAKTIFDMLRAITEKKKQNAATS